MFSRELDFEDTFQKELSPYRAIIGIRQVHILLALPEYIVKDIFVGQRYLPSY
jgi:hypothetical protein